MKYTYKTITLRDGRQLAYSEFGDPKGYPVINCHGGLVNRLDVAWAQAAAKKKGVRIISPDRPGIGYSSVQKGRTMTDWANDVGELASQLKLKKFGVLGWSMGGQYAMACAHSIPKQVSHLVLIASCLDLSQRKNFEELNPMDRRLSRFAHNVPWLNWLTYALMSLFVRCTPKMWRRVSARQLCKADQTVIEDQSFDFVTPTKEALRKPSGMIEEYRVFNKPWGFKPSEIKVPTSIWQGRDDTLVPFAWAEVLDKQIPKSQLNLIDESGHFIARQEIDAILSIF